MTHFVAHPEALAADHATKTGHRLEEKRDDRRPATTVCYYVFVKCLDCDEGWMQQDPPKDGLLD